MESGFKEIKRKARDEVGDCLHYMIKKEFDVLQIVKYDEGHSFAQEKNLFGF